MSRKLIYRKKFTKHGYLRVKERTTITDNEINTLSSYAIKNGVNYNEIIDGPLKMFVWNKQRKGNKRVKLYRGYVFIFFLNSRRLITCYPIPDEFLEDYKKSIQNKKEITKKYEKKYNRTIFKQNNKA